MGSRLGPKEAKRRLTASEKQARVVELYTQGWTFRSIAKELGYGGPSGVKAAIDAAIKKAPSRAVNELRAEVDERSRVMLEQLMPIVVNGRTSRDDRLAAIDRVIKIDKELRALHGLDAPAATIQLTAEVASKDVRQELLDRIARLAESASASEAPPQPE